MSFDNENDLVVGCYYKMTDDDVSGPVIFLGYDPRCGSCIVEQSDGNLFKVDRDQLGEKI